MTSYTVTATTTNNATFGGGLLQVDVLDNALVAGSPAIGSSSTAYNCSVTTTADGSLVFGSVANESADTAFTAEANCTILTNYSNTTNSCQYASFMTTNTTTGTPGATTVGSTTAYAGSYAVAAMEILSSGGTLSVDAVSPAAVTSLTGTSFTTASFAPAASSTVLVAMFAITGNLSAGASLCVATVSSTPSLTWTEQVKFNGNIVATGNCAYVGVWTAVLPPSLTVTPPSWAQRVAVVPFSADVIM